MSADLVSSILIHTDRLSPPPLHLEWEQVGEKERQMIDRSMFYELKARFLALPAWGEEEVDELWTALTMEITEKRRVRLALL